MRLPDRPPEKLLQASAWILLTLLCVSILVMWMPNGEFNPGILRVGLFLLTAAWGLCMAFRPFTVATSFPLFPMTLAAAWGLLQLVTHSTVSRWETTQATITWSENLAAFFLALQISQSTRNRRFLLLAMSNFALAITIVSLLQFFSMPDKVFWYYYPGYSTFGPIGDPDHYAAFAELMIPVSLFFALTEKSPRRALFYALITATLFAAAIAGSSRAGAVLCVAEILLVLVIAKRRGLAHGRFTLTSAKFVIMAVIFTTVVGYATLFNKFQTADPYAARREMLIASIHMAEERPWLGFGLGNFINAYPAYSVLDMNKIVNHAHNDWAEWTAEGGIPFSSRTWVGGGLDRTPGDSITLGNRYPRGLRPLAGRFSASASGAGVLGIHFTRNPCCGGEPS